MVKNMLYSFFLIIVSFFLQIQLLPLFGLNLNLFLLIIIYYGLLYGWRAGAGIGFLTGLIQDVFSGGVLGLSSVGFIVCGVLAGYCKKMLLLRYWFIRVGLVFTLTFLNLLIYLITTKVFSEVQFFSVFKSEWAKICFGNAILAGIVFWITDRYG